MRIFYQQPPNFIDKVCQLLKDPGWMRLWQEEKIQVRSSGVNGKLRVRFLTRSSNEEDNQAVS